MSYRPCTTIKEYALVDFIIEFTYSDIVEVTGTIDNAEATKEVETKKSKMTATKYEDSDHNAEQWTLYIDDASNENGSRVGMTLISPKGHKIHCMLRFGFQASNNDAEYEALIMGLNLAKELRVRNLNVYNDSQLVVSEKRKDGRLLGKG